jgi:hypothetical protein
MRLRVCDQALKARLNAVDVFRQQKRTDFGRESRFQR